MASRAAVYSLAAASRLPQRLRPRSRQYTGSSSSSNASRESTASQRVSSKAAVTQQTPASQPTSQQPTSQQPQPKPSQCDPSNRSKLFLLLNQHHSSKQTKMDLTAIVDAVKHSRIHVLDAIDVVDTVLKVAASKNDIDAVGKKNLLLLAIRLMRKLDSYAYNHPHESYHPTETQETTASDPLISIHAALTSCRSWIYSPVFETASQKHLHTFMNALVSAHAAHRHHQEAHHLFLSYLMSLPDTGAKFNSLLTPSYISLIRAYCSTPSHPEPSSHRESISQASSLLNTMISQSGIKPSIQTYTLLLKACASKKDLAACNVIHDRVRFINLQPDAVFYTVLLDAHVKSSDFIGAMNLHNETVSKSTNVKLDTRYFNALLNMHAKSGDTAAMLHTYEQILTQSSTPPDEHTYTTLIDAYMRRVEGEPRIALFWMDVMTGRKPYALQILKATNSDADLDGSKSGADVSSDPSATAPRFWHAPIRPTVPTYTALISGYAHRKDLTEAMRWFRIMRTDDKDTTVHGGANESSLEPNLKSWTAALHAFVKSKDMNGAEQWIRSMNFALAQDSAGHQVSGEQETATPVSVLDSRAYNTMIGGYAASQDYSNAIRILEEMREKGVDRDAVTFGMLIDSHLKRTPLYPDGNVPSALSTYKEMVSPPQNVKPTLHILTSLIARIGHIAAKADASGRPTSARSGGVFPAQIRLHQNPPPAFEMNLDDTVTPLTESKPSPPGPSDRQIHSYSIPLETTHRKKAVYSSVLHQLYHTYRRNASSLLSANPNRPTNLMSMSNTITPSFQNRASGQTGGSVNATGVEAPLPIYDALIAHHTVLHKPEEIRKVYLHALLDGAQPDESMTVRAVKGLLYSKSAGWHAAVEFLKQVKRFCDGLRSARQVLGNCADEGTRTGNSASSSGDKRNDSGGVEGLLLPADFGQAPVGIIEHESERDGSFSVEFRKVLEGAMVGPLEMDFFSQRWMSFEVEDELVRGVLEAVIAGYPGYALSFVNGHPENQQHLNVDPGIVHRARRFLHFDETARLHGVAIATAENERYSLKQSAGAVELWNTTLTLRRSLNAEKGRDKQFQIFVNLFIRHCELNGLWEAKEQALDSLRKGKTRYDDTSYRQWLQHTSL
ncbi:hypothetical protein BJ741DRAFT_630103 [Chytriomyces cf. hyalinus JEL632]|nr:hypothetical protein BJ741DRAFT_630103 [Chytriomyces cf. hyalinus JEL632]